MHMGAQAFIPPSMARSRTDERPSRARSAEALALLLFAGATFLVLALASLEVHPEDPTVSGSDWMGTAGAALAGMLSGGFGAAAWWVPLELCLLGAPLFRARRPQLVGLTLAGDLLILVFLASLLQVALPDSLVFGHLRSGGNVGLFFGELMRGLFSAPGSFLVGSTAIGLILIGRSSFSFIDWVERVGRFYRAALVFLLRVSRSSVKLWRRASALRRAEDELRPASVPSEDPEQAIVRRLEMAVPWIPDELTGAPPLAVVERLRAGLGARFREDSDELLSPGHDDGMDVDEDEALSGAAEEPRDGLWQQLVEEVPSAGAFEEDPPDADPLDADPLDADFLDEGAVSIEEAFGESLSEEDALEEELVQQTDTKSEADGEADDQGLSLADVLTEVEPPGSKDQGPTIIDTSSVQATHAARPEKIRVASGYRLPDTALLDPPQEGESTVDRAAILRYSELLEKTLADYGVTGKVEEIHPGPTVTTYEVAPAAGTKVSKVASLSDDLALGLSRKVRIIAPIPGKSRIGFELPNDVRSPVNLRELIEDIRFQSLAKKAPLPVVLGRDIVGAPFYADLASMPHVIVAGATGAGKSVGLNVMLSSLLFKRTPEELRLLMIDPKVVELAPFDRIPHLLLPVVTDMSQASQALKWAVDEMERRYQLFADAGTKNITTYNRYVERVRLGEVPPPKVASVQAVDHNGDLIEVPVAKKGGDGQILPEAMPYIVIVVDEFADLIMQQGKEVETSVARLAQKARAAGMHVILATQRPSVDVITGMIKANFPSRIAFRVAQKVDSRTILDEQGAEVLLGKGDKLVKLNGSTDTLRVQCPFISEEEVSALCDHLRAQGEPQYDEQILEGAEQEELEEMDEKVDARFDEALLIVRDSQRCSTSWLQRKMTIGYNRAAKMVDMMERRGFVGPPNGSKDREVLLPP